ncbi:hypothetical protein AMELA_G00165410 [Ameiurus melas]|uniref:Uncharacterized protein n=1 Tax=Ameiurus melas TaxID=219545 RepID=A0A7J6AAP4_AMEME|nr:hypothetical protein AMELA_G00165410 [Ameiurus melas]
MKMDYVTVNGAHTNGSGRGFNSPISLLRLLLPGANGCDQSARAPAQSRADGITDRCSVRDLTIHQGVWQKFTVVRESL